MADSPSPVLQLRIQSVGSNVNLWGGYINTDLAMIEQAAKGFQSLAVTGDALAACNADKEALARIFDDYEKAAGGGDTPSGAGLIPRGTGPSS